MIIKKAKDIGWLNEPGALLNVCFIPGPPIHPLVKIPRSQVARSLLVWSVPSDSAAGGSLGTFRDSLDRRRLSSIGLLIPERKEERKAGAFTVEIHTDSGY